ncbi:MAG: hypothetical protein H7A45_10780 [Verrucomicrobiales bacterium]|nr:hypothetical protein [Verrucomicrobiales bacterium]
MKTKRIIPWLASAACLLQVAARANDIEPGKEYYTAIKAPNPIVLDGDLSEWKGASLLADPRFSIPKGSGQDGTLVFFEEYAGGTWTGPDDQTSAVQVVYDDDNVYFGFVVTDDYHENSANSAWNGDSVQLMIANDARDTQVALYNYALGGIETALGDVIVMHEAGPATDAACECATEAVVVRNTTTKRTIYEIKLPKASLGLDTLTGGVQFGLGMAINDGDEATPGQKGWGGLGAHALVFGKSPDQTALVTLAQSNDIEPGKEYYTANPAPNAVVLDGNLNEWTGVPVLSDPKFAIPKGSGRGGELVLFEEYAGGTWSGPDDQTSAVQVVYDADNIYFGFVVTDDYHENSANSAWNGDSVQLMIANGKQDTQVALYNYALGGIESALGDVIVMHEAGPATDAACDCATEAVITRNTTTKRTVYEIKLPKASLGLDNLDLGTQFGLGMAINDGDEDTPGQKGWGGLGAHALVFGKSPQQTALVTLGIGGGSGDLLFFSAINPTLTGFSFRANDKGDSIVDPATAKLYIDGQLKALTASPKNLDATDFTYDHGGLFPPDSQHTYLIEVMDTNGNTVTDSGTFKSTYLLLTPSMKAVSHNASNRGFLWRVFQHLGYTHTSLAKTEAALAGQLTDDNGTPVTANDAQASWAGAASGPGVADGPVIQFEIPTVLDLYDGLNANTSNGNFGPDGMMPGVFYDMMGIDAEILTFVDLPAGWITLGVNSDDGFRAQAGYINNPADGIVLGQFDGARGPGDTTFDILVQEAGVYPLRVIYNNGDGNGSIEIFSVLEDGTKVLLNDTANGGRATYRTGVAPEKPTEFSLGIGVNGGAVEITWTQAGVVLQMSTDLRNWSNVAGATSPYRPTTVGTTATFYRLSQ